MVLDVAILVAKHFFWNFSPKPSKTPNTGSRMSQVNAITPGRSPKTWRALLPGHAARAAFKYGLIEDWGGYEKTLNISRIDENARSWNGEGTFSEHIREPLPLAP